MIQINIHEAKANLSKYLELMEKGEQIVICRRNIPVARLNSFNQQPKQRQLGLAKSLGSIPQSFFEPLDNDELALWNDETAENK